MNVWLVSRGEYSDYEVVAVFTTRELAQQYVDAHGEEGYRAPEVEDEPRPVVESLPPFVEHLGMQTVIINGVEAGTSLWENSYHGFPGIDDDVSPEWRSDLTVCNVDDEYDPRIIIRVEGLDVQRVRKVFSEMRAHAIAEFDLLVEQERRKAS